MMADPQAPPAKAGGGKAFWTHKLGPFPVYVWAIGVVAVGGYYWYTHYGPGASKQQSGQQGGQGKQQRAPRTRITETIRVIDRRGRGRSRGPRGAGMLSGSAGAAGDAAQAAAAGVPAQYGGGPGPGGTMAGMPAPPPGTTGPGPDPDKRRDRDKRDRDKRRRVAVGSQEQVTTQQTGQPVNPDTGQPVYWEWTHAHRGPEVSHPVPEPQQAYAPMTNGATYDAASASTAADALAG